MKPRALICGVSGQDGAYLAKYLIDKGYDVYGTSRDAEVSKFTSLSKLGINNKVNVKSMALNDFRSVLELVVSISPHEIYNLAGQSSVGISFQQPIETMESIVFGTLNLLEAIRFSELPIRFYNAGSSESFGDTNGVQADERTPFSPRSPYAVAKSAAFWEVVNYREAYGIHAASGILFNHESVLRPERFVTKKIVSAAVRIKSGSNEVLKLGRLDIARDWGWAPEYVDAMWKMLQLKNAEDFIVATGETYTLESFVEHTFNCLGLDWREHVRLDSKLCRPTDLVISKANPQKAREVLGWAARTKMPGLVELMIDEEMRTRGNDY